MARQTKPLSVKEIESAKPKEADYVLYDGDGLELLIKSSGSKIWQFRYIRPVTKKRAKKSVRPLTARGEGKSLFRWSNSVNHYKPGLYTKGLLSTGARHSRYQRVLELCLMNVLIVKYKVLRGNFGSVEQPPQAILEQAFYKIVESKQA